MPKPTFFALPTERRDRLVREAIAEFADRAYAEASLSQIARRARIPKGSFYQYFDDKLDLYRFLLTDEAPRRKRAFVGDVAAASPDFWQSIEDFVERGMAFLVEHPLLARLSARAADPTAIPEVRGLHHAICEAGLEELRSLLEHGVRSGAIAPDVDLTFATRLVASVIGPGLTDAVLEELGAELHEVLASDSLRKRLGPTRRRRLARHTALFLRHGLAPEVSMIRYDFQGRVAFVTGGTSGIGLATARAFARAGASVVLAARRESEGTHAVEALESEGARVLFVPTDVNEDESVTGAVARASAWLGRLDFAANCAGIGGDMATLENTDQATWDLVMTTNARGVWLSMRHEIPKMLETGGGAIVNVSSIYGLAGKAAHHAYVASKHAVLVMTKSVALEYATRGIRVNALCAGVWLCSSGAGYVTGAAMPVDGGFLAA